MNIAATLIRKRNFFSTYNMYPTARRLAEAADRELGSLQMLNWTRIKQGDLFVPAHYMKDFSLRTNENAEALAKEHGYENWIGHFMARRDMSPKQPFTMPELSAWTLDSRDAIGIYMVRNPYFWAVDTAGNQLPYIDRIEARYFSDKQVAILSMMQGKIDIGGRMMNPDEFPLYVQNQEEGDYRVLQWQDTKMTRVGYQFNLMHLEPVKRQVFSDIRFRRAMSVAIDRNAVNEFAFQGLATPTQMTIAPGASWRRHARRSRRQAVRDRPADFLGVGARHHGLHGQRDRGRELARRRPAGQPAADLAGAVRGA